MHIKTKCNGRQTHTGSINKEIEISEYWEIDRFLEIESNDIDTNKFADKYSKIVDKIGILPLNDLAIEPLVIEAMEIFMNQQVVIPITQARKLVPFNTTYWVGWPTEENNFNHPATWWMSAHQIIHRLRKSHH